MKPKRRPTPHSKALAFRVRPLFYRTGEEGDLVGIRILTSLRTGDGQWIAPFILTTRIIGTNQIAWDHSPLTLPVISVDQNQFDIFPTFSV